MTVKASHLCRLMVESLLDMESRCQNEDEMNTKAKWPDFAKLKTFVQLFTKGQNVKGSTKPTAAIDLAWSILPANYPLSSRHHSDYNLINYCARTFQTCFLNNLRLNFISRQRLAIKTSLDTKKNTLIYALQCLINDWKYVGRTYSEQQLRELNILPLSTTERYQHSNSGTSRYSPLLSFSKERVCRKVSKVEEHPASSQE